VGKKADIICKIQVFQFWDIPVTTSSLSFYSFPHHLIHYH